MTVLSPLSYAIPYIPPHLPEDRSYSDSNGDYKQEYNTPSLLSSSQYVLTFDDGPNPTVTPKILNLLKRYGVKATFFIIAKNINSRTRPIIKRIVDEGHIIASHDYTHDNNNNESREKFKSDLKKSITKIYQTAKSFGQRMKRFYFRFPMAAYGRASQYHHMNVIYELSQEMFNENCIHFVFWDNDSSDWVPGTTSTEIFNNFKAFENGGDYVTYRVRSGRIQKIYDTIPGRAVPSTPQGGVVLLHDIHQRTIKATELILQYASRNNIDFVPLYTVEEFGYPTSARCRLQ